MNIFKNVKVGENNIENQVKRITLEDALNNKFSKHVDALEDNKEYIYDGENRVNNINKALGKDEYDSNNVIPQLQIITGLTAFLGILVYIIGYLGYLFFIRLILGYTISNIGWLLVPFGLMISYLLQVILFRVNYKNYVLQRYFNVLKMEDILKKSDVLDSLNNRDVYLDFDSQSETYLRIYVGEYSKKTTYYIVKDNKIVTIEPKDSKLNVLKYYKDSIKRYFTDYKVSVLLAVKGQ